MALFNAVEAAVARRELDRARRAVERSQNPVEQAERAADLQHRQETAFRRTPAGRARISGERGDLLFQVSVDIEDVMSEAVVTVSPPPATDVSEILTSISVEGWDLHSMSTAFAGEGGASRDASATPGRHAAGRGRLVGTYVFVRAAQRAPGTGSRPLHIVADPSDGPG